jgi:hypothetical protein
MYLDPQAGFLLETYIANKDHYLNTNGFTEEAFDAMPGLIQAHQEFLRQALKIPGLKILYGSDSVAGAHGRNAEDFIYRVLDCGMDPILAMVSANSPLLPVRKATYPPQWRIVIAISFDKLTRAPPRFCSFIYQLTPRRKLNHIPYPESSGIILKPHTSVVRKCAVEQLNTDIQTSAAWSLGRWQSTQFASRLYACIQSWRIQCQETIQEPQELGQ